MTPIAEFPRSELAIEPVRETMSLDAFLALPDDPAMDRMLIDGQVWEKPMTVRGRNHAFAETKIASRLDQHADSIDFEGQVASGEAGVIFEPLTSAIGIDVVIVSEETVNAQDDSAKLIRGVPLMTVEILSGSETVDEIDAKLRTYLKAGVRLCWIVAPRHRTVIAHRPGETPTFFAGTDPINADPAMPGFSMPTVKLFER